MLNAVGDDTASSQADVHGTGGFSGVFHKFPYGKLFNLYLDPKEQHSYLIRKLAYQQALVGGVKHHLGTFAPPNQGKLVVGLNV
jgi:arylsulfatase